MFGSFPFGGGYFGDGPALTPTVITRVVQLSPHRGMVVRHQARTIPVPGDVRTMGVARNARLMVVVE